MMLSSIATPATRAYLWSVSAVPMTGAVVGVFIADRKSSLLAAGNRRRAPDGPRTERSVALRTSPVGPVPCAWRSRLYGAERTDGRSKFHVTYSRSVAPSPRKARVNSSTNESVASIDPSADSHAEVEAIIVGSGLGGVTDGGPVRDFLVAGLGPEEGSVMGPIEKIDADGRAAAVRNRDIGEELGRELVRLHPDLLARALFLTQGSAAADDLVQDVVERAWLARHRFQQGTNLKAWLHAIM